MFSKYKDLLREMLATCNSYNTNKEKEIWDTK